MAKKPEAAVVKRHICYLVVTRLQVLKKESQRNFYFCFGPPLGTSPLVNRHKSVILASAPFLLFDEFERNPKMVCTHKAVCQDKLAGPQDPSQCQ